MALKRLTRAASALSGEAPKSGSVPTTADDGAIMISAGKYARNVVLTVFEMIGGINKMAEWADENPGDYYTKIFTKTLPKEVETKNDKTVEDLLEELARRDNIIDVTPTRG